MPSPQVSAIKFSRQGDGRFFAQIGQGHIRQEAQRLTADVVL